MAAVDRERTAKEMDVSRVTIVVGVVFCGLLFGCGEYPRTHAAGQAMNAQSAPTVRKVATYDELKQVLENEANPGDVVEVQPGVYYATASRIAVRSGTPEAPIIIRGVMKDGKRPAIDGTRVNTNRGLITFTPDCHDVIVENIEVRHAVGKRHEYNLAVAASTTEAVQNALPGVGEGGTSTSEERTYGVNAGGMYFQGKNITVRNCFSHHNEDGWFATHDADYILIENCEIGWNGTAFQGQHNATHNFYFCAEHQMVKNCYIHDPRDGQDFKSRGSNTIFAFNWVDEDYSYTIEQASGGQMNTLWLGNVVSKRTTEGLWQGRVFAIGDGSGVVHGTVVAANNTFITYFPRDHFVFTFPSGDADLVLVNNVFAGPAEVFAYHNGKGTITGTNNWIRKGAKEVPAGLENTVYGDDPGFADPRAYDFTPAAGSQLINAGASAAKYKEAIDIVLANATTGTDARPSAPWMKALDDVKAALRRFEPLVKDHGFKPRRADGAVDIGAYEAAK